jgi:transcriptional regulator with XRE-family HTH domain
MIQANGHEMRRMITATNPKILVWARERCGLSVEDTAKSFGKDSNVILRWESGEIFPSYTTLEALAYDLYKIPLAVYSSFQNRRTLKIPPLNSDACLITS